MESVRQHRHINKSYSRFARIDMLNMKCMIASLRRQVMEAAMRKSDPQNQLWRDTDGR